MSYIKKYSKFNLNVGDIVLIHYWWDGMITPVEIIEKSGRKFLISHNNKFSKIKNAPNEYILKEDVIDYKK